MKLEGVSAVVTGGGSGLGEATIRGLHAAGAKVVALDRDEARAQAVAASLGEGAVAAVADVTDADGVQAAIDAANAMAPLRVAVSCAGIGAGEKTVARDGSPHAWESFERVIRVNLLGTFNVLRLASAAMAKHDPVDGERGVVVNTASIAAFDGQIGQLAYSASKGGVVGMTLPAARDLMKQLVRVVTIAPGLFDTPLLAGLPDPVKGALSQMVPNPSRLGSPSEYAALVRHIAENGYINGEVIRIDGALRMPPK